MVRLLYRDWPGTSQQMTAYLSGGVNVYTGIISPAVVCRIHSLSSVVNLAVRLQQDGRAKSEMPCGQDAHGQHWPRASRSPQGNMGRPLAGIKQWLSLSAEPISTFQIADVAHGLHLIWCLGHFRHAAPDGLAIGLWMQPFSRSQDIIADFNPLN